jgi:hypothetical protein
LFTVQKRQPEEPTPLETEIARLLDIVSRINPDDEKYADVADQIVKLYKLKEVDSNVDSKKRVSPDTLAVIIANLLGIGAIIGYEHAGVISSKAFGLVMRLAR